MDTARCSSSSPQTITPQSPSVIQHSSDTAQVPQNSLCTPLIPSPLALLIFAVHFSKRDSQSIQFRHFPPRSSFLPLDPHQHPVTSIPPLYPPFRISTTSLITFFLALPISFPSLCPPTHHAAAAILRRLRWANHQRLGRPLTPPRTSTALASPILSHSSNSFRNALSPPLPVCAHSVAPPAAASRPSSTAVLHLARRHPPGLLYRRRYPLGRQLHRQTTRACGATEPLSPTQPADSPPPPA